MLTKNIGGGGKGSARDSAPSRGEWGRIYTLRDAFSDSFVVLK